MTRAQPLLDSAVRKVALVRLRVGLGDLLASVPALRSLREARPDAHVVMVTWPDMAPVVDRMGAYVDELLSFPGYPGIPERPPDRARLGAFLEDARQRRFDLAVQMYGALPAANEVTDQLGARVTAGFFSPGAWSADLATHLPYPAQAHEVDRHLRLVAFLGAGPGRPALEFPIRAADDREAATLRAATGTGPGAYAIVHPGATAASRRWPPARFAAVGDGLAARGLDVLVTGVASEAHVCRQVCEAMAGSGANLCGATSLGGLAALVKAAAVVVTNDSGPTQLAAALGTPSVTVYLAGDPARWAPFDAERHRAVRAGVECQPCPHQRCPIDHRCATRLSPKEVMAEVDDLLGPTAAPASRRRETVWTPSA